jgi:hypothetical protein
MALWVEAWEGWTTIFRVLVLVGETSAGGGLVSPADPVPCGSYGRCDHPGQRQPRSSG